MTGSELQDLIVGRLFRKYGGRKRQWQLAVGPVTVRDLATHPHCNWSIAPAGSIAENEAIERLLDEVRASFPLVVNG
ncbi:hypothetical protein ACG3SL_00880 [Sphingomonas sp. CJ20]